MMEEGRVDSGALPTYSNNAIKALLIHSTRILVAGDTGSLVPRLNDVIKESVLSVFCSAILSMSSLDPHVCCLMVT